MLAQTVVGALRALTLHILPDIDGGWPLVRKPTGTLITTPPDTQIAAGCNLPVSQVLIFGTIPLPLQLWPQQAECPGLLKTVSAFGRSNTVLSILVPAYRGCCSWFREFEAFGLFEALKH